MLNKYSKTLHSESWDFIKGYKKAIHINVKPEIETEAA